MARTFDEVRDDVMGLADEDRQLARLRSGEDRELTLDEFWSDAEEE
jgi:hypothetical protein